MYMFDFPGSLADWSRLGGEKNSPWNPGKGLSAAAVAAARAAAAAAAARQRRVDEDARTPHARPPITPTITQSILDAYNDAFNAPPIDLGVLDPTIVNGGDSPYRPTIDNELTQPGALLPLITALNDSCTVGGAARADGTRAGQIWTCGQIAGSGPAPGVIEVSDRVKSAKAFQRCNPSGLGMIEYVFDLMRNIFAVGWPASYLGIDGSPHQSLARSIGADESIVLGGMFSPGHGRAGVHERV